MKNFVIVWANTSSVKYINYHFTQLGEVLDYLDNVFPGEIDVVDADAKNLDHGKVLKKIIQEKYKAAAFYVSSENVRETINLAALFKDVFPNIGLVAYGPLTVLISDFFCSTPFDAVYADGDVEEAITSFFNYSKGDIPESELSGLKLRKKNKMVSTKPGFKIDFNKLGFPRFDRIPVKVYNRMNDDNKINITLSRGCSFSCPHCLVQRCEGHSDRRRNLDKLREYLSTVYPKYTEIKVFSPNFTLNKKYVCDFCDLIKKNFPKLKWDCATRVDMIDEDTPLRQMYESGCTQITLGIESLSPLELSSIGKKYDLRRVEKTIKKIRAENIVVKACIMLGIKGQTRESLLKTLEELTEWGAVIRPMIYAPYHELKSDMSIDEIERCNRKFFNVPVCSLSKEQLVRLFYSIDDFRNILSKNGRIS